MERTAVNPSVDKQPHLLRQILAFSLPLIVTSVLQLLFNTADSIVVGRWGGDTPEAREAALAAVGSCGSLISLIVGLFVGLASGAGVLVSRGVGANDAKRVDRVVHTAVPLAMILGVFVTAVGFAFAETFLTWMGMPAAALAEATPYLRAYFLGMPAAMVYNYCAAMIRATGDTVRPMIFLTAGGVLNVLLNLVAVLVFRLGAMGVGIATAASNWLACLLIIIYMVRKEGLCHLDFHRMRFSGTVLQRMLIIGVPIGIQSVLFAVSNVLIQTAVNSLDSTAFMAGNSAVSNVEGYVYTVQNAFAQAALTYVSQAMGAGRTDRAHRAAMVCTATVTVAGVVLCGAFVLLGRPLLSLFIPDNEEALLLGLSRMKISTVAHFMCGLMEVGCCSLRALGKSVSPTVISLFGVCFLRVAWIYTVFAWFPTGTILYLSYPVTWSVTTLVHYIAYFAEAKRLGAWKKPTPSSAEVSA